MGEDRELPASVLTMFKSYIQAREDIRFSRCEDSFQME